VIGKKWHDGFIVMTTSKRLKAIEISTGRSDSDCNAGMKFAAALQQLIRAALLRKGGLPCHKLIPALRRRAQN